MTREECENLIAEKLEDIMNIYKEYNPKGKYLSMCIVGNALYLNNEYYEPKSIDGAKPINFRKVVVDGGKEE